MSLKTFNSNKVKRFIKENDTKASFEIDDDDFFLFNKFTVVYKRETYDDCAVAITKCILILFHNDLGLVHVNWMDVKNVKKDDKEKYVNIIEYDKEKYVKIEYDETNIKIISEEAYSSIYDFFESYLSAVLRNPPIFYVNDKVVEVKKPETKRPDIFLYISMDHSGGNPYLGKIKKITESFITNPREISTELLSHFTLKVKEILSATDLIPEMDTFIFKDPSTSDVTSFLKKEKKFKNLVFNGSSAGILKDVVTSSNSNIKSLTFSGHIKKSYIKDINKVIKNSKVEELGLVGDLVNCEEDFEYALNLFNKNSRKDEIQSLKIKCSSIINPLDITKCFLGLRELEIRSTVLTLNNAMKAVQKLPPNVTSVTFCGINATKDLSGFENFAVKLNNFAIRNAKWSVSNFQKIINACFNYRNTDLSIDFSDMRFDEKGEEKEKEDEEENWENLFKELKYRSDYITKIVWDNNYVTDDFIEAVIACSNLRSLSAKNYKCIKGEKNLFVKVIKKLKYLNELIIPRNHSNADFVSIIKALKKNHSIQHLDISGADISKTSFMLLTCFLNENTAVNHINAIPSSKSFSLSWLDTLLSTAVKADYRVEFDWPTTIPLNLFNENEAAEIKRKMNIVKGKKEKTQPKKPSPPKYYELGKDPSKINLLALPPNHLYNSYTSFDDENTIETAGDETEEAVFDHNFESILDELTSCNIIDLPSDSAVSNDSKWKDKSLELNRNDRRATIAPNLPDITEFSK